MALSKVQGAQIESPVDISAVNLTGVTTATDLNITSSVGVGTTNRTSLISLQAAGSAGIGSTLPDIAFRDKNGTARLKIKTDTSFASFSNQILSQNYFLDLKVAGPAQNTFRIFTAGSGVAEDSTERVCVTKNGYIGIATQSPSRLVDIGGNLVVDSNGNLGIGTTNPSDILDINSTSTDTPSVIRNRNDFSAELHLITQNNASSNADTVIRGYRSRGTGSSPAAVQTGDRITRMIGLGWDGSGWSSTFSMNNRVEGTVATGSLPSNCVFELRTQDGNINDVLSIDSQGSVQVGIATTTGAKSGYTSVKPSFVVGGLVDKAQTIAVIRGYNLGSGTLSLQRTNSTSRNGTYSTTADGNLLGALVFEGVNSSNNPYPTASIESWQVGTAGAYVGGDIRFSITRTNDGLVEFARMSHNNSNLRAFLIGRTLVNFAEALVVTPNYNGSTQNYGIAVVCTGTSNQAMRFANNNGIVGSITMSGSATAYNTSSDYRLKENVSTITGGLSRLMQLNPIRFNWISDETDTQVDGFLAHEVSPVVPESINGEKDEMQTDEEVLILDGKIHSLGISEEQWNVIVNDPNRDYNLYPEGVEWRASFTQPKYQGIDQAKLVPLLVAALKELTLKVNTLEAAVGIAST